MANNHHPSTLLNDDEYERRGEEKRGELVKISVSSFVHSPVGQLVAVFQDRQDPGQEDITEILIYANYSRRHQHLQLPLKIQRKICNVRTASLFTLPQ